MLQVDEKCDKNTRITVALQSPYSPALGHSDFYQFAGKDFETNEDVIDDRSSGHKEALLKESSLLKKVKCG